MGRGMRKVCVFPIIILLIISGFLFSVNAAYYVPVQRVEMPRFDQITACVADWDTAWQMFLNCTIDFLPDVDRDVAEEAASLGHGTVSWPTTHVGFIGINCRDYVPDDVGQPGAGRSLAPLNWSEFRQALAWAGLSMEEKECFLDYVFGPGAVNPCSSIAPQFFGGWHNPIFPPGGNYTKAWEILQNAGFYISDSILYQPNGVPVRDEIHVLSPVEIPCLVEFVDFVHDVVPLNTLLEKVFYERDFDLFSLYLDTGIFPDLLYDWFHSSQGFPQGGNCYGIANTTLDELLEKLKFGLNHEEKVEACQQAQKLIVEELVPVLCCYRKVGWAVFKRGYDIPDPPVSIMNLINMRLVGPDNDWTWNLAHWNTSVSGGEVGYYLGVQEPDNLHPGGVDDDCEWWILDRCMDEPRVLNPDLIDVPWIAVNWTLEPFNWPPLGIFNGTAFTMRIRDDVYWQDGWPLTAEDIRFSWNFMKNFPHLYPIYRYILWIEIHDPNTITAYLNITSQWYIYDLIKYALVFPKHIYNPEWHPTRDPVNDPVWTISWQDWMSDYTGFIPQEVGNWRPGDPPPSGLTDLKALVGCGPYYFVTYAPIGEYVSGYAILKKNPNYWVKSPVIAGINIPGRIDPETDYPFKVIIENAGAKKETTGELGPVLVEYFEVYVDGTPMYTGNVNEQIYPFEYANYSVPGYVLNLPCGFYNVTLKVYEKDIAEPITITYKKICVTLREDLNYDIYVGIDDIVRAAEAFGSQPPPFPGCERWDERADLNDDFYVGIDDIVDIAEDFGKC